MEIKKKNFAVKSTEKKRFNSTIVEGDIHGAGKVEREQLIKMFLNVTLNTLQCCCGSAVFPKSSWVEP
jgi:hypothetical protein